MEDRDRVIGGQGQGNGGQGQGKWRIERHGTEDWARERGWETMENGQKTCGRGREIMDRGSEARDLGTRIEEREENTGDEMKPKTFRY
jgi:hypothetical protein